MGVDACHPANHPTWPRGWPVCPTCGCYWCRCWTWFPNPTFPPIQPTFPGPWFNAVTVPAW